MLNTWQNIIKHKMQLDGETQESLADKLGVSQGSIAHWLSGRRKPDTETISKLMNAVGLTKIVLNNDGSAEKYPTAANLINIDQSFHIEALNIPSHHYVNSDIEPLLHQIAYHVDHAKQLFGDIKPNNLKVINIRGDSMQKTFEHGDTLFIDITINRFDGDGIYVFTFGPHLYVKRLQVVKTKLIVIADNSVYKEWHISESETDQLHIHGKVLLSQSMQFKKF